MNKKIEEKLYKNPDGSIYFTRKVSIPVKVVKQVEDTVINPFTKKEAVVFKTEENIEYKQISESEFGKIQSDSKEITFEEYEKEQYTKRIKFLQDQSDRNTKKLSTISK